MNAHAALMREAGERLMRHGLAPGLEVAHHLLSLSPEALADAHDEVLAAEVHHAWTRLGAQPGLDLAVQALALTHPAQGPAGVANLCTALAQGMLRRVTGGEAPETFFPSGLRQLAQAAADALAAHLVSLNLEGLPTLRRGAQALSVVRGGCPRCGSLLLSHQGQQITVNGSMRIMDQFQNLPPEEGEDAVLDPGDLAPPHAGDELGFCPELWSLRPEQLTAAPLGLTQAARLLWTHPFRAGETARCAQCGHSGMALGFVTPWDGRPL